MIRNCKQFPLANKARLLLTAGSVNNGHLQCFGPIRTSHAATLMTLVWLLVCASSFHAHGHEFWHEHEETEDHTCLFQVIESGAVEVALPAEAIFVFPADRAAFGADQQTYSRARDFSCVPRAPPYTFYISKS